MPSPARGFRVKAQMDGERRVEVTLITGSAARLRLAVVDNPDGKLSLARAAVNEGALAGVNGGYFHPDLTPLGLVIAGGVELHPFERARLLSGLVYSRETGPVLQRSSAFRASRGISAALQAGPFLVEGGKAVAGLDGNKVAVRTIVLAGTAGEFGIAQCRSSTLAETGKLLAALELSAGSRILRAMNLDGGTSSALWFRRTDREAEFLPGWKQVRNYLLLLPKTGGQ